MTDPFTFGEADMVNGFGKFMLENLQGVLERDLRFATAFGIAPSDIAIMGMKVAASVANAFILVAVQMRKEDVDASSFYDDSLAMLNALMPAMKVEGLCVVAAHEASK